MPKGKKKNKFWNFKAADEANNEPAELILYGDISSTESWWYDTVTPKNFSDELMALGDVDEIVVRINSGGGDVFAANAIYTRLKDHKANITVKIDGWAASAATIIAMAGDSIEIPRNAVFMIHDPKMGIYGYYSQYDFIKMADELKIIKQSIINGYALKTGKDDEEIASLMANETWFDGNQAVENGFCDKLMFEEVETEVENASKIVVNSVSIDISNYKNIPKDFKKHQNSNFGVFSNIKNKNEKKESGIVAIKTVEELKAQYPDLTNALIENAAKEERERIKNIEEIGLPGFEEEIKNAKFENPMAAAEVAMQILAKQKEQGKKYLDKREEDIQNSKINEIGNQSSEGTVVEDNVDSIIDKVLPGEE